MANLTSDTGEKEDRRALGSSCAFAEKGSGAALDGRHSILNLLASGLRITNLWAILWLTNCFQGLLQLWKSGWTSLDGIIRVLILPGGGGGS